MGTMAIAAIMLLIGFFGGVVAGIVVIVSVASRREDRHHSLADQAPDSTCEVARHVVGRRRLGG